MSTFTNAFKSEANKKFTENGCEAYKSTNSSLLDLFATIGALRERDEQDIIRIFSNAYEEDSLYATKCLFYGRDIRGGCGERRIFRVIFKWLARKHPEAVKPNIKYVGEYGRFDDLYCLVGTPCEKEMWAFMKEQFEADLANLAEDKPVSLLAKWIKSADASSKESRELGKKTAEALGYSVYDFKRLVRKLRKQINLVETKMCANDWDNINYESVPSRAMSIYRKAFNRHSPVKFTEYVNALISGDATVKATTLYPYDIVEKLKYGYAENNETEILEQQWKALPDYVVDADNNPVRANILVMADVSGSMTGRPMDSAVGLALYFAERNKGEFHNMFMTFESNPHMIVLNDGETLKQKITTVMRAGWNGSTDFAKALRKVLELCKENNVPASEVPKALVCISDMEFDSAICGIYRNGWSKSLVDTLSKEYEEAGYTLPVIVFWNVNARNDTFHTDMMNRNALCVSGQSVSAFKTVMSCIGMTPYEALYATLGSARYEVITVAND